MAEIAPYRETAMKIYRIFKTIMFIDHEQIKNNFSIKDNKIKMETVPFLPVKCTLSQQKENSNCPLNDRVMGTKVV